MTGAQRGGGGGGQRVAEAGAWAQPVTRTGYAAAVCAVLLVAIQLYSSPEASGRFLGLLATWLLTGVP
jgi:negative regulator of sigma E activity